MKPENQTHSSEAARLERDYLDRLRTALAGLARAEASEVEENIRDHIASALSERCGSSEAGLVDMAAVLDELGPPEAVAAELSDREEVPVVGTPPPAADRGSPAISSLGGNTEFFDRLFLGYLFVVAGLWIPFIELYFCHIAGYAVLLLALRKSPITQTRSSSRWALVSLILTCIMLPLGLLSLAAEIVSLLALPFTIAWIVFDLVLLWTLFGGLANHFEARTPELASYLRGRRLAYVIFSIAFLVLALIIGGVLVAVGGTEIWVIELAALAILPFWWIVGWFVVLKPIRRLRTAAI